MSAFQRLTQDSMNTVVAAAVFLFSLAIYTITLTPSTAFWDAGEFVAAAYTLGIPHAPGTPLYVIVARLFSMVPVASVAVMVNWFSALMSAVTIVLLYLVTVKVTRKVFPLRGDDATPRRLSYLAGVVTAILAGFATTFWDNAIEAEVYAASCAIMTFAVWLILRWEERLDEGNEDGLLLVLTYLVGLGVGIHLGVAVVAWAVVAYVFLVRPQYLRRPDYVGWAVVTLSLSLGVKAFAFMVAPIVLVIALGYGLLSGRLPRLSFWAALVFIIGVSVHFFLIIRSNLDPMINEAAPKTWDALWKMLIRDQYKPPAIFPRRAPLDYQFDFMWLRYVWWNFSLLGEKFGLEYGFREFVRGILQPTILLFIAGAVVHLRRHFRTGALLGMLFLLLGPAMVIFLQFKVGEVRERDYFFVQNYLFMAVWVGVGAAWLVDWLRHQVLSKKTQVTDGGTVLLEPTRASNTLAGVAATILLAMSFLPLVNNFESHDRRGFHVARNYAYNMLEPLGPDAVLFTNGDNDTFPLWYIQEVEGVRKDVRVVNLSLLNTDWYIKQLRDLDPKVPIAWSDDQIALLRPVRRPDNSIWLVKDIATHHIIQQNQWRRPVYIAVTVPDRMGYDPQLSMEGLVFRINPQPVDVEIDLAKSLENLNETFDFGGVVIRDPAPGVWGVHDSTVYKDDNATKLIQNYAAAFARVALRLMDQGKFDQALEMVDRAEVVSPSFPGLGPARGIVLEEMGDSEAAKQHYRNLIAKHPGDWQLYHRLGEVYVREYERTENSARLEEALGHFITAMEVAPPDQYAPYQALASSYYRLDRYEDAARVLQRWLATHPNDREVKGIYDQLVRSLQQGGFDPGVDTVGAGSPE